MNMTVKSRVIEVDRERIKLGKKKRLVNQPLFKRLSLGFWNKEFRRAVFVPLKRFNSFTNSKKLKRDSETRRVGKVKSPTLHHLKKCCISGMTPGVGYISQIRPKDTLYRSSKWEA